MGIVKTTNGIISECCVTIVGFKSMETYLERQ